MREQVEVMGGWGGHPSVGGTLLRRVVEGERDADVGKIVDRDGITPCTGRIIDVGSLG